MSMHTPIVPRIAETGAPDTVQPAPELTIVIPTFKERHNVAQIVERLRSLPTAAIGKSFLRMTTLRMEPQRWCGPSGT
jgi:hypothetical protein